MKGLVHSQEGDITNLISKNVCTTFKNPFLPKPLGQFQTYSNQFQIILNKVWQRLKKKSFLGYLSIVWVNASKVWSEMTMVSL